MKQYVVGFLISDDYEKVVLIEKKRPKWQQGCFNGPGGEILQGEEPLEAMIREFKEETGLTHREWTHVALQESRAHTLHFFYAVVPLTVLRMCSTQSDEEIFICSMNVLMTNSNKMLDLPWIVPFCIQHHRFPETNTLIANRAWHKEQLTANSKD